MKKTIAAGVLALIFALFTCAAFAGVTVGFPSQSGNAGKFLQTDGTNVLWATAGGGGGGTVTQVDTGVGLTGGPITTTGTIDLADTAVTPGSYTFASITVDQQGRLTAAASGATPANVNLSNVTATAIPVALRPNADGVRDLGTSTLNWNNGFIRALLFGSAQVLVDVENQQLIDSSGNTKVNWGAANLLLGGAQISFPNVDGSAGQVLATDGGGNLSFVSNGVTSVTAGTGLNVGAGPGGTITSTGTLNLADTTVTPGSYTSADITVDAQGRITAAANGTAGANTTLSNLANPTAINQDLRLFIDTSAIVGTSDRTGFSGNMTFKSGASSTADSGSVNLRSGDAVTTSGEVVVASGTAATRGGVFLSGSTISLDAPETVPNADATRSLGSASFRWSEMHAIDSLFYGVTSGSIRLQAADATTSYGIKFPAAQGAASTFLQNDGAGNLSWVAGGGGGANTSLTNLVSPVRPNQSFEFDTGATAVIKTKDETGIGTRDINITSGTADLDNSSGNVDVRSAATTGVGPSGEARLFSGNAEDGATGEVHVFSGDVTQGGSVESSGLVSIRSGQTEDGQSGEVSLATGAANGTGSNSGQVNITSGASTDGVSGGTFLLTGNGSSDTGLIQIATGEALNTGAIQVLTGNASDNSGNVSIKSGVSSNTVSGSLTFASGDGAPTSDAGSGNISIFTGLVDGTNPSGNITIVTGNSPNAGSGEIQIATGTSGGTRGLITIDGGDVQVTATGTFDLSNTNGGVNLSASSGQEITMSSRVNRQAALRAAIRRATTSPDAISASVDHAVIADNSGGNFTTNLPPCEDGLEFYVQVNTTIVATVNEWTLNADGTDVFEEGGASTTTFTTGKPKFHLRCLTGTPNVWYILSQTL